MSKKEFVSNVTGEVWHKENIKNWKKWYDKVGVLMRIFTVKEKMVQLLHYLKVARY